MKLKFLQSFFLAVLFVLFFSSSVHATIYYTGVSGSPTTLTLWWTATNGTGTHPANFTTVGDIFTIQSTHVLTTTGNWTVAGSVVVNSGGTLAVTSTGTTISLGGLTINSGGIVNQNRPLTVTGATVISGTINFASTSASVRAITLTGDVTLNSGAVWTEPATGNGAANTYNFGGNFTNNATTFNALGTGVHTFSGAAKTISGSTITSIGSVAVTGTPTNTGILTVRTALTGAGILINGNGSSATLNLGGTITITGLTATAVNNLVNYTGVAQTAKVTVYNNLTLSGSLVKTFATTPTVNGVLSMEGTASVVVTTGVVTYGASATLQYNKPAAYVATLEEWISPFMGSGGIIIMNSGAITTPGAVQIGNNTSVPLNINIGATLTPGANLITLHGDFINAGTLTSGAGGVTIAGNVATQSIAGFITTGTIILSKSAGTATFQGNVNGGPLTINGSGTGTLNLGTSLTHTFTGDVNFLGGSLNGGSSILIENNLSATAFNGNTSLFIAASGTVIFGGSTQSIAGTGTPIFNNLTVSNTGLKSFTNIPTVNGVFSMEGTATVSAAPTYGSAATLQYNTATSRVAGAEWITPFVASGGVVIANTGIITMNVAKVFNSTAPLTVKSGASLSMSTFLLTLNGNLINNGGTASGTSGGVTIAGTATQSIGAFTTTGTILMSKTGGTATLTGYVNGGGLTINGSGGVLNLGVALTHTFTGVVTLTAGSLNGGSSTLNENAISITAWNGNASLYTPSSGTINFGGAGNQTLSASSLIFYNLVFSGSGNKTFSSAATISNNLTIAGTAIADLGSFTHSSNSLTFIATNQSGGSWGSTASSAAQKNNTYFLSTSTGVLNVSCTAPSAPTSGGNHIICSGTTIPALTVTVGGGETVDWFSVASGGSAIATSTLTYTPSLAGTYYAETRVVANGCLSVSRTAVVLTINPLPTVLSLNGSSICTSPGNNGSISSTTSQSGVNYQLYNSSNATIQSPKAGNGSGLSWSSLTAGDYYVTGINATTSCTSTTATVTISTNPNPVALVITGSSICANPGGNGIITSSTSISGINYQLYFGTNTPVQTAQAGTGSPLEWTTLNAANAYFVTSTNASTSCASGNSNNVNITTTPNPIALILTGSTICASPDGNGTISSSASENGIDYQLFDNTDLEVGLPITGNGSGLLWTGLTAASGYYALGTNSTTSCVSDPSNAVNITTTPNPTVTSSATATSVCYSLNSQNTSLAYSASTYTPTTYTISWNTSAHTAGLVDLGTTTITTSPLSFPVAAGVAGGNYTGLLSVQNDNGCISTANSFTLAINTAPAAPTGSSSQIFCSGSTVANLTATGSGILWYAAAIGGTATSTSSVLVNGTHYYASQTVSGCQSSSRMDVTAIVVSAGSWIGTTSTNWFTTTNWCGGSLPTASTNVNIAAGLSNYPSIGASGAVCNNITIASGALLTILATNTLTVSGNWTNSGTFTANSSMVDFNGSASASIGSSNFYNITFSGAGTKTATGALSILGSVNISNNFTAGSFTHTVGGNWTKSGTFTAGSSTIDFNGSASASIGASNFNNISFSGAGAKTATGILAITGNVNITNNFTAGAFTHTVGGNWSKSGTFTHTSSTIDFNGSGAGNISASNFNNIIFSGSGSKSATGILSIVGNITISHNFSAGSYTHTLQGNWVNNGSFTAASSTFLLNGSSSQTINGSSSSIFNNLSISGSGGASLGISTSITGILSLSSGKINIGIYDLTITSSGSISGGSAGSYVKTSSNGRLKQTVPGAGGSKIYPVGNSAYNPMTVQYNDINTSKNFNIRVADATIINANSSKTVNRQWYLSADAAGSSDLTLTATFNGGEEGTGFSNSSSPKIGYFDGTSWAYRAITSGSGTTTFVASGSAPDFSNTDGFFALGSDDAFNASKLIVTKLAPINPSLGVSNTIITVQSQNSQSIPTMVNTASGFTLTATNTTMSATPSGTIGQYTYETNVTGITFTLSTYNTSSSTYSHNANVTVTRTSGETLSSTTSANFDVYEGTIYEPITTENWDASNGWRKSTDGGGTWTSTLTLPTVFVDNELIRVPLGITLTANVTASFYSMLIYGTLDINSSGNLTLNHSSLSDYNIHVHEGTLKNSGGTLSNTNSTDHPIEIHGGTYWHNMNGGSIPVCMWTTSTLPSTCKVEGITSIALSSGLNQIFENFSWDNVSQTVTQTLSADLTVNNTLSLLNGKITTADYHVIVGLNGTASNAGAGYINGNLRRYVASTVTTGDFPVGDANYYAPFSISVASGTPSGNGYLDVSTSAAQPPLASGLSQSKYINRKWTISNNGVSGITTYNPSCTFNTSDKVGSPSTALLRLRKLTSATWYTTNSTATNTTVTTSTALSTAGLTATSDFYAGEDDCNANNAIWLGSTSTDWNTASNWCSGSVPTVTTDVSIPSSPSRQPVIGAAGGSCNNINIQSGASLSFATSSILDVKANWVNSGSFAAGGGSISFSGTSTQTITGNTIFYNLTINNSVGVVAANDFSVNGILNLNSSNPNATHGTLDMGSYTLSMLSASASVSGSGDVTGIVKRTHTFTPNTPYQFGSQFTTLNFLNLGTQPDEISCKIEIGSVSLWKPGASKRYYSFAQTGTSGTDKASVQLRYLTSELNSNDESKLVFWDHHTNNNEVDEHGKSNNSTTDHWVRLSGLSINYIALTSLTDKQWGLADYSLAKNTWLGADVTNPTKWDVVANWSGGHIPLTTDDVLIPTGLALNHYPELTLSVELKSLEIESGASLTGGTYTITINGYNAAWQNNGTFYPGTGTVNITHGNINHIVSISGSTQFHNVSIAANTFVRPGSGSFIKISGDVVGDVSSIVDLSTFGNTVEYNGSNQYIVNPSTIGFAGSGYYNLIISGTGAFLVDNLDISGDFTSNSSLDVGSGTVSFIGTSAQIISGSTSPTFNMLTINNPLGVTSMIDMAVSGTLTLASENPVSLDKGSLAMAATKILNLGADAITTGIGDVSGIIQRTHSFIINTFYSFGNQYQGILFPVVASQTLPTSLSVKVSIGIPPSWSSGTPVNVTNRLYEFSHTGGSGTSALIHFNYKDNELASGVNESSLSIWSGTKSGTTYVANDLGWSGYDVIANYITISNVDLQNIPSALGDFQVAIAPTSTSIKTWNGNLSTDWNNASNWTPNGIPTSSYGVIIPDANTTVNQPLLPAYGSTQASCQYIIIETGGVLNGGTNTSTLTITDGVVGDAWGMEAGGTFNAGNSTVLFAISGTDIASISGSTNFYKLSITGASGSKLRPAAGSYIGISGSLDFSAGYLAAATNENTIEFKGNTTQNIPNPNGSTPGYHNLIISGSGSKILAHNLNIYDEFTNNTTATNIVDAATNSSTVTFNGNAYGQAISGTTVTSFYNLNLDNIDGLSLNGVNASITAVLTFTSGKITTNANVLTLDKDGSVSGAAADKYVFGTFKKGIAASTSTKTFEIGNTSAYLPVIINFNGTATNGDGYLSCATTDGLHPNYSSSNLNQTKYINRYWTLNNSGVSFGTYNASFTFLNSGDIAGSANLAFLLVKKYSASTWSPSTTSYTSTTVTSSDNNSFSDFVAGEASTASDYFRSSATGMWSSSTNWESSTDGSSWNPASITPDYTAHSITISNSNTITVDANASASNLYIVGSLAEGSDVNLSVNGIWDNSGSFITATGTVTFNGTTTIAGTSTNTFNNLIVSGSLTAPAATMYIAGNLINSGTFNHNNGTIYLNGTLPQTLSGTQTFNNLTINNAAGVKAAADLTVNGILNLISANPSSTKGALYMGHIPDPEYILYMGANATTIGTGDVSGYLNRSSFALNTDYTFGNKFTLMNFTKGPLPGSVTLEVYLTASNLPFKTDAIHRYYDISRNGGSATTRLRFNVHYLDAELNGATEGNLDLFDYHVAAATVHDHGFTDYNSTDNWVGFGNVGLAFLGTASSDDHLWTLGTSTTNGECSWVGGSPSGPTDWDLPGNWEGGVPTTNSHVYILTGNTYYPVLPDKSMPDGSMPDGRIINTIDISSGGVLNATSGTATLTISGAANAWVNFGSFNAGESNVIFTNALATMKGETNFNNLTVSNTATLTPQNDNILRIGGGLSLSSTGVLNAASYPNTIEYNKSGDQIVMFTGGTPAGYSNLNLSGSGSKTMPASALSVNGNFIISGTATVVSGGGITIGSNLILGAATSFSAGSYSHSIGADFENNGCSFNTVGSSFSFNGSNAQTIGGTVSSTFNNLSINNANGVSLLSAENIEGVLEFSNGKVTLGSHDLLLGSTASVTSYTNSKYIVTNGIGALSQRVSNNQTNVVYPIGLAGEYLPLSLQLTTASTADDFKARVTDGLSTSYDGNDNATGTAITNQVVNKTWSLKEAVGGGSSATITLQWNASDEGSGFDRAYCKPAHYTGNSWKNLSNAAVSGSGPYTQTFSGINTFSPFGIFEQELSGNVNYYNQANTLLTSGITMELYKDNNPVVADYSFSGGTYHFKGLSPGTYEIRATSSASTDGSVNGTDAAQVNAWGVNPYSIEKVRFYAGDVTGSGNMIDNYANATDAQRIMDNFVNGTSFDRQSWTFWNPGEMISSQNPSESYPSITLAENNLSANLFGLCTGDFNRSFVPGAKKSGSENLELITANTISLGSNQEIELPLHIVNASTLGATSLILKFPVDMVEILNVSMASDNGSYQWAVNGNELRIVWFSTTPLPLMAGDEVLKLKLKTKTAFILGNNIIFNLAANSLNELADGQYNVIPNAILSMDALTASSLILQQKTTDDGLRLSNYPNPFNNYTIIDYTLPFDGLVILEIRNLLGETMQIPLNETQSKGHYSLKLDTETFHKGVYLASLSFRNSKNSWNRTIKICK